MAVTDTEEPGRAHADCRSMEVEATPEESVVAELGENTAPDGPENDTGSPAEAAPAEVVTDADTADAPAARTRDPGDDTETTRSPDAAKAGDADVRITAGTLHAAPATIVRREIPPSIEASDSVVVSAVVIARSSR